MLAMLEKCCHRTVISVCVLCLKRQNFEKQSAENVLPLTSCYLCIRDAVAQVGVYNLPTPLDRTRGANIVAECSHSVFLSIDLETKPLFGKAKPLFGKQSLQDL